jgi:hypothetical protein
VEDKGSIWTGSRRTNRNIQPRSNRTLQLYVETQKHPKRNREYFDSTWDDIIETGFSLRKDASEMTRQEHSPNR